MPDPYGKGRLNPDDLAKRVAEHLSRSTPTDSGFSWRNSVFVGRLISALVIVALAGGLAFAVTIGFNWWTGRSDATAEASPPSDPDEAGAIFPDLTATTVPGGGQEASTTTTLGAPFATTTSAPSFSLAPVLPSPTTTTTPAPAPTSPHPTSPPTTSQPNPTTPTTRPTTTTTSNPLPPTTLPPPTTTTSEPPPTSTTTLPPSTTTSSTLAESTTTTIAP